MCNDKGMTLIEMIVSILVLSIATTMLFTGFSKVISLMSDGAAIKNVTNEIVSGIEGNPDAPEYKDIIEQKSAQANIIIAGIDTPVSVYGSVITGSKSYGDGIADTIDMANFSTKVLSMSENEKKALRLRNQYMSFLGHGLNADGVAYITKALKTENRELYNQLARSLGKTEGYNGYDIGYITNNDIFRNLFFFYMYFPQNVKGDPVNQPNLHWQEELDISKMKDKQGKLISQTYASLLNAKPYYMQTYHYYLPGKETFFVYASISRYPDEQAGRWDARFVFNSRDNHWYFKTGTNFQMTGIGSNPDMGQIKLGDDLLDKLDQEQDGWIRIYE